MRKSRVLRLSQTEELDAMYRDAGVQNSYSGRFIRDMLDRLQRERGITKKQRTWLDSLIEDGAPETKGDPVFLTKIKDAADLDGMQHRSQVLMDFYCRLAQGYELTEKQLGFLNIMLAEATKIIKHGKFRPADPDRLTKACELLSNKGEWYWAHRGGTAKAYNKVGLWLDWNLRQEHIQEMESRGVTSVVTLYDEPYIDEWSCNKVLKAAKKGLAQIDNPRHVVGALCYVKKGTVTVPAMVMSMPAIVNGDVRQDVLVEGELISYLSSSIRKRR